MWPPSPRLPRTLLSRACRGRKGETEGQSAAPLPSDPDSRRRGHALQMGRGSKSLFVHVSNPNPTPSILLGPWPACPQEMFLHWFNEYTMQKPNRRHVNGVYGRQFPTGGQVPLRPLHPQAGVCECVHAREHLDPSSLTLYIAQVRSEWVMCRCDFSGHLYV